MLLLATWLDVEIIILSKWETERQTPYDITYMWTLNNNTNEHIYTTEADSQTRPRRGLGGGGKDWEYGTSRHKLLYIGGINHKVLPYSIA